MLPTMPSKKFVEFPYLVHTNRELGLMLRGVKPLAYFMEASGYEPDCMIRYFRLFDRHVASGRLIKRETLADFPNRPGVQFRRTFFALPAQDWRIDAMLALLDASGPWSEEKERWFGELLGYEDWQNDYWLKWLRKLVP